MTAPVSLKEYFAAASSPFTKADAETIGPQLEALAEAGPISERTVVDVARSPNSPLDRYFEWTDEKAADLYRLGQAGTMMRSIRVRTVENGRPRVVPVYRLVAKPETARPAPKGYNVLHENSAFAAKMAAKAFDDLLAWRARYTSYLGAWVDFAETFRQVTNQIGEFEETGRPADLDHEIDEALAALITLRGRFDGLALKVGTVAEQAGYMNDAIEAVGVSIAAAGGVGQRLCMNCSDNFYSSGPGNRLCLRCNRVS